MSVYNTDFTFVKRAIDSVFAQDFQDFEIILIDDGSTHELSNQLLNYAKLHSDKISSEMTANPGSYRQGWDFTRKVVHDRPPF